jgi:16S rRNA (adenine1518-N6/adenine1519-N6)-dimethyltransferase
MPQSKREIRALLEGAGISPRHRFGQNFMIDQNLLRLLADAAELMPGDLTIEVGPGTGALTEELLHRGAEVLAVEIDRDLAGILRQRFAGNRRFELIEGDVLAGKHGLHAALSQRLRCARESGRTVKLAANLPYNVASPLVVELLLAGVDLLAFTVQREVARRLKAAPATEEYGALSVMVQLLAEVQVLRVLPPQAFWPEPRVESALVRLRRRDLLGGRAAAFSGFVHRLFSFRRKTLRRSLAECCADPAGLLAELGIASGARPEQLSPTQLLALHDRTHPAAP